MPAFDKPILVWSLTWDADWVTAVSFVGSSRKLVAGNNLGQILLWELPEKLSGDPPKPTGRLDGHSNVVSKLAATTDGKVLISSSYDHGIRYWNIDQHSDKSAELILNARAIADAEARKKNGAKVPPVLPAKVNIIESVRTLSDHKEWVTCLELSRDGKTFISGDDAGNIFIWDREAGSVKKKWKVKGWASAVSLSSDGQRACVGERLPLIFDSGRHTGIKLWNATNGEMLKDLAAEYKGQIFQGVAFSPDGKLLALGRGGEADGNSGSVTLIEGETGKKIRALTPGHLNGLTDLAFHPEGKILASTGRDTVVRLWDCESGKMISELGKPRGAQFKDWLHALAWSPDGNLLATADMAGMVHVWRFDGA
jgi:WD40 repeat protein